MNHTQQSVPRRPLLGRVLKGEPETFRFALIDLFIGGSIFRTPRADPAAGTAEHYPVKAHAVILKKEKGIIRRTSAQGGDPRHQ